MNLALIADDADAPDPAAPKMTWVHWVLYNMLPDADGLAEDLLSEDLPEGTLEGVSDWKRPGYGGSCPPVGHFHKIHALDTMLPDLRRATKAELETVMQGKTLRMRN
jgi:Raf kinase inhibitor-like YbhB/YbcL family protein